MKNKYIFSQKFSCTNKQWEFPKSKNTSHNTYEIYQTTFTLPEMVKPLLATFSRQYKYTDFFYL